MEASSPAVQSFMPATRQESAECSKTKLKDLITPAFVINRHAFEKNCRSMIDMAKSRNLAMRPHIKTHKTSEGAWIQANAKRALAHDTPSDDDSSSSIVTGFVASTLPEISMLIDAASEHGGSFRDILYSVPICEFKLQSIEALRRKLVSSDMSKSGRLHIMMDHPTQVAFVESFVQSVPDILPFSVFLKLDTGYHRAGVPCDERGVDLALQILDSPHLELTGVYSHCGHAYDESEASKQHDIANVDLQMIKSFLDLLKSRVPSKGALDCLTVSVGSTPSARHHENTVGLPNVEIHPGNYTFYDRQQLWIGACTEPDLAGRVISRVIGHYPDRNTMMLDVGATALTQDSTPQGGVCAVGSGRHNDDTKQELDCFSMSQEVTLVRPKDPTAKLDFAKYPLGSIVNLLPNHSCLAAACFDKYHVIDDPSCTFSPDQVIVDEWIPAKYFALNE